MAINLSDLTNASTSGDILAEAQTTADFLDSVPLLKNLADPSGATDGKQFTATKQPTALPLIDNEGYLFCSGITGNSATIPHDSSLNLTDQLEVVVRLKYRSYSGADAQCIVTKWASGDFNFRFHTAGYLQVYYKDSSSVIQTTTSEYTVYNNNISDGDTIWVKMTIDATSTSTDIDFYTSKDNVKNEEDVTWTALGTTRTITTNGGITSATNPVSFGAFHSFGAINDDLATGAVLKANYKSTIGGSPVLDVDFTAPNVRHGDTKFKCATGQVVTINQSGNDPATVIKKPVLRFDGVDDFMDGVFGQTVTGGYMFAAFSVNGDGGESFGNILNVTSTGQNSGGVGSFAVFRSSTDNDFRLKYNNASSVVTHQDVFDDAVGDIMLEGRMEDGSQITKINNADEDNGTTTLSGALDAEEFVIAADHLDSANVSIDLEYLAFFPSLTDKQADQVRNYINNRNNVFYRWDTDGYYFFDPQKATFTGDFSASNTLDGYITGSDKGDTDVRSDLTLEQATLNAQPSTDGYKITFSDDAEYLNFTNGASQSLAGWQVVGTSLGTFVYKVNARGQTEINLLGNKDLRSNREPGDLYGIILLPESATNRDIEEARKLLIDRGASDGTSATTLYRYFDRREDIVEFNHIDTQSVTSDVNYTWRNCTNMTSFPALDLSNCGSFNNTWQNCSSLTSFPAGMFDNWNPASIGNDVFNLTWDGCSSLTSQSVENILVSIAASGKYATTSGESGGTALTDPEIDIDYDGSGLTAATTTAITTLKSRGWGIVINGNPQ